MRYWALAILLLFYPFPAYSEEAGSLEILIQNTNGDRVDPSEMVLKLYKDLSTEPFIVSTIPSNPYTLSLELNHKYIIEIYNNDMFAGTTSVDLKRDTKVTVTIPLSGGMRVNVFYNDGTTPIEGATVYIDSEGKTWRKDITDKEGKTTRFWIQSTLKESDYYTVKVTLGDNLVYEQPLIRLEAGFPKEIIVVTPWPARADLIISVYKTSTERVSEADGRFFVELKRSDTRISIADRKGNAYFNNIPSGDYILHVSRERHDDTLYIERWGSMNVTIAAKEMSIDFVRNEPFISGWKGNNSTLSVTINNPSMVDKNVTLSVILDRDKTQPYDIVQNATFVIQSRMQKNADLNIIPSEEGVYYRYITASVDSHVTDQIPWEYAIDVKERISVELHLDMKKEDFTVGEKASITYSITNTGNLPAHFYIRYMLFNSTSINEVYNTSIFLNSGENRSSEVEFRLPSSGEYIISIEVFSDPAHLTSISKISKNITVIRPLSLDLSNIPSSCRCVAFRLDGVQDYFTREAQMDLISTFLRNNSPLTISIIGGFLKDDLELIRFIHNATSTDLIEVANGGWNYTDHSKMSIDQQFISISKTNERIKELFDMQPSTFVPPYSIFNEQTLSVIRDTNLAYISSATFSDEPSHPLKNGDMIFHFPQTVITSDIDLQTGRWFTLSKEEVLNSIRTSIDSYGFAVVSINPIAYYTDSVYERNNETLDQLLKEVKEEFKLVKISEIDQGWIPEYALDYTHFYTISERGIISTNSNLTAKITEEGLMLDSESWKPSLLFIPKAILNEPTVVIDGKSVPSMKYFDPSSERWVVYIDPPLTAVSIRVIPEFELILFSLALAFLVSSIIFRRRYSMHFMERND